MASVSRCWPVLSRWMARQPAARDARTWTGPKLGPSCSDLHQWRQEILPLPHIQYFSHPVRLRTGSDILAMSTPLGPGVTARNGPTLRETSGKVVRPVRSTGASRALGLQQ